MVTTVVMKFVIHVVALVANVVVTVYVTHVVIQIQGDVEIVIVETPIVEIVIVVIVIVMIAIADVSALYIIDYVMWIVVLVIHQL